MFGLVNSYIPGICSLWAKIAAGQLRLAGSINGGAHDFLANQVIGGLPACTGILGGVGMGNFTGTVYDIDFNNIAGDHYVTLKVPAPASAAPPASVISPQFVAVDKSAIV